LCYEVTTYCGSFRWLLRSTFIFHVLSIFLEFLTLSHPTLKVFLSLMIILSSRKFHYLSQWSQPNWTKSLFLSLNLLCNIYCHSRVYIFCSLFTREFCPTGKELVVIPVFMKGRSAVVNTYRPTIFSNNLSDISECVIQEQLSFYFKFQLHPSYHVFTKSKPNTNN